MPNVGVQNGHPMEVELARVLVVDDDADERRMIRQALKDSGHEVREAADGYAAELADEAAPADILILDVHMPNQDGIETLRSFRRRGRQTRIVMIGGGCALCQVDFLPMARRLGADATLRKPVAREDLLGALAGLLPKAAAG